MLYDCPECGLPATATTVGSAYGTDGPVDVVRVRCVSAHWFLGPGDTLRRLLPDRRSGGSRR